MFQKLVNLNSDLKQLVDKGYALSIDTTNHLIVHDIPYLDSTGQLRIGAIVCKLKFLDKFRFEQNDHQIYFAGGNPYTADGNAVRGLGGGACTINLSPTFNDVVVQRSFSVKPKGTGKYNDHFHKLETYVGMISGPAINKHNANPYTFRLREEVLEDPVFKFRDTLTSRSDLGDLSEKLSNEVVAIIGLGGTGAYLLDFLSKTPVKEIIGFDHDYYHVHNTYRSPGRLDEEELGLPKAEVYERRYQNFRHGLSLKNQCLDEESSHLLENVTFAFVCVDNGDSRKEIFDILIRMRIPFIDTGLGVKRSLAGDLSGMLRATYFSTEDANRVREKKCANESEDPNNLYKSNIQISELNALNACMAILQYKQIKGFYEGENRTFDTRFNVSSFLMVRENAFNENED